MVSKSSMGSRPNISWKGLNPVDLFMEQRRAYRMDGICVSHLEGAWLDNAKRADLRSLCDRSTGLLLGLYGGVKVILIFSKFPNSFIMLLVNCVPWSECICSHFPNLGKISSVKIRATSPAVATFRGNASNHLVNKSFMVNKYTFFLG